MTMRRPTTDLTLDDRLLRAALTQQPRAGLADALADWVSDHARTTRQRRRSRWLPVGPWLSGRPGITVGARWPRALTLVLAVALLVLAALAALLIAGRVHPQPHGNGVIAFSPGHRPDDNLPVLDGLSIVAKDGSGLRQITTDYVQDLAWSPDGSTLAYWQGPNTWTINLLDVRTGSVRPATSDLAGGPQQSGRAVPQGWSASVAAIGRGLDWSGDGRQLLVRADVDGLPTIASIDVRTGAFQRLLATSMSGSLGSWSPDGRWLAYWAGRRFSQANAVYLAEADGTKPRILVGQLPGSNRRVISSPAWSPDSTSFLLVLDQGSGSDGPGETFAIYDVSVREGTPKPVKVGQQGGGVAWSPLGDRIAVWSDWGAPDGPHITVMTADGSDPHVVATHACGTFEWSPDGARIVYGANGCGATDAQASVMTVAADGTDTRTLWSDTSPARQDQPNLEVTWQGLAP